MLQRHLAYAGDAVTDAAAAPLSRRKALLAALLIDGLADRLFSARDDVADRLAWRAELAARSAALTHIFALAAGSADLQIRTVTVPLEQYGQLSTADFMVSLYNGNTVQRLMLVELQGRERPAQPVLAAAFADLEAEMQRAG